MTELPPVPIRPSWEDSPYTTSPSRPPHPPISSQVSNVSPTANPVSGHWLSGPSSVMSPPPRYPPPPSSVIPEQQTQTSSHISRTKRKQTKEEGEGEEEGEEEEEEMDEEKERIRRERHAFMENATEEQSRLLQTVQEQEEVKHGPVLKEAGKRKEAHTNLLGEKYFSSKGIFLAPVPCGTPFVNGVYFILGKSTGGKTTVACNLSHSLPTAPFHFAFGSNETENGKFTGLTGFTRVFNDYIQLNYSDPKKKKPVKINNVQRVLNVHKFENKEASRRNQLIMNVLPTDTELTIESKMRKNWLFCPNTMELFLDDFTKQTALMDTSKNSNDDVLSYIALEGRHAGIRAWMLMHHLDNIKDKGILENVRYVSFPKVDSAEAFKPFYDKLLKDFWNMEFVDSYEVVKQICSQRTLDESIPKKTETGRLISDDQRVKSYHTLLVDRTNSQKIPLGPEWEKHPAGNSFYFISELNTPRRMGGCPAEKLFDWVLGTNSPWEIPREVFVPPPSPPPSSFSPRGRPRKKTQKGGVICL
uniref:Uncharacterized protein n=1 Tax=Palpitomonas bilix TaxID=652834 RepID=A0A7S3LWG0_9EUKA|mmetsp:Transcript_6078/g.14870  ORF Transcript_6078/g.14870 Transcript_6078/m.14870 type:complete len:530 (+) Transcript_6078:3403-4992(+)